MIISHSHRFIFVRPIKVAGASVELALRPHCTPEDIVCPLPHYRKNNSHTEYEAPGWNEKGFSQHSSANTIREMVGEDIWNEYRTITIVRNPWSLMVSLYHWSMMTRWGGNNAPRNFSRFVWWNLFGIQGPINKGVWLDDLARPRVDEYIRFESLEEDCKRVFGSMGIQIDGLPRVNTKVNPHKRPYQELYPSEVGIRQAVRFTYLNEIAYFGYKFEADQ